MKDELVKTIVVVDDDPVFCRHLESRLTAAGYQVFTVTDPDKVSEVINTVRPGVLLLDLMMPKLHGYAVLQEIRRNPELSGLHILVASSKSFAADIRKAKELGADEYITKPVDFDDLVRRLEAISTGRNAIVQVRFWGTRGSIATPGSGTLRYGGNTSCVEFRHGNTIFIIDCGTGARELGESLQAEFKKKPIEMHMFISHTHWDHIQGFPFFVPAYIAGNRLTVYSIRGADKSLRKVFTGQMDSSYFPVSMDDLHAHLDFVELQGPIEIAGVRVSYTYLNHPGVAIGFRFDFGGKSIAYISDHEPYSKIGEPDEHNEKLDRELDAFVHGVDLYIREAQYNYYEHLRKSRWGHSTWMDAVDSAQRASVKRLALFHHDPSHDDEAMDKIVAACERYMKERGINFECFVAAEKSTCEL